MSLEKKLLHQNARGLVAELHGRALVQNLKRMRKKRKRRRGGRSLYKG